AAACAAHHIFWRSRAMNVRPADVTRFSARPSAPNHELSRGSSRKSTTRGRAAGRGPRGARVQREVGLNRARPTVVDHVPQPTGVDGARGPAPSGGEVRDIQRLRAWAPE